VALKLWIMQDTTPESIEELVDAVTAEQQVEPPTRDDEPEGEA
jgi:hypothetical protein